MTNKNMPAKGGKKYELLHQETNVSPLTLGVYYRGFHQTKKNHKYLKPLYFKNSFVIFKGDKIDWYGDMENFQTMANKIIDDIKKDKTYSQRLLKDVENIGNKLYQKNQEILKKDLTKESNTNLIKYLKTIYQLGQDISDLGMVAVIPDLRHNIFSKYIKQRIQHRIYYYDLNKKVNDYFSILISSPKRGFLYKEKLAIIKVAKEIIKNKKLWLAFKKNNANKLKNLIESDYPNINKQINNLIKKYCWLNFGQIGPAKSYQQYLEDLKDFVSSKNLNQKEKELLSEDIKLKQLQTKYIKELHFDNLEKNLCITARNFTYNKILRFDHLLLTYFVMDKILLAIAKRIKFAISDLRYASLEEIINLLNKQSKLTKKVLQNRKKYCVNIIQGKGIKTLIGQTAKQYVKQNIIEEKIKKDITTIHGTTAFIGQISGVVKIVNTPKDLKKVNVGDILVSVQTNPELLPGMKKAAAFVTDIGGITSHAAIVARELKKPCIVGTKIASKILKDGDKVMVDAVAGDVKKI